MTAADVPPDGDERWPADTRVSAASFTERSSSLAELAERVAALEQLFDGLMILQRAERRARERANGTHLRAVPDPTTC